MCSPSTRALKEKKNRGGFIFPILHRRALKLREGRPLPLGHTAVRRDPAQPKCDSPTDPISPTPTFSKATSKILGLSMHLRQPFQQRPVCVGWLAINGSFLVLHPNSESSTDGYQRQSPAALNAGRRGLSLERSARLSSLPCCSLGREIRKDDSLSASSITCQERKWRNAPQAWHQHCLSVAPDGPGLQSRGPPGQTVTPSIQSVAVGPGSSTPSLCLSVGTHADQRYGSQLRDETKSPFAALGLAIAVFPGLIYPPQDSSQAISSAHHSLPRALSGELLHNLPGQFKCHLIQKPTRTVGLS